MPFKMNLRPMMRNMAPMARNNMPQGGLNMAAPRTGYRMPQNPMMASPGGGGGFDERTGTYIKAPNPIFNALRNVNIPMTGGAPNTRPGILGGIQPRAVTPEEAMAITSMPATRTAPAQPAPTSFDRNAALQAFNARAAEMNASGKGLFNSGVSPDEFRMYQGILRNLQLNPNSTPEQHADILNKSMAFLNQYSGATPQPMVDPNVPYRPTGPDAFYGAPPAPAQQMPQNAQGMALGGLMAKYRGGMC